MVSGAYSSSFVIDTLEDASVIGAHFEPAGAFPFLGLPAGELADFHVDLETLWGRTAAIELREQLCAAPGPEQKFRLLEQALLSHLYRPLDTITRSVRRSRRSLHRTTVGVWARWPAGLV
jgi:hypothetical protein